MAVKLPNSIFCHVGRTAGHWVRRVLEDQDLARGEIAGFHDWPSRCWEAEPEKTGTFTFCFIRHPLSWLRSYWMHNMQFGWENIDEYSSNMKSWKFEEFLENGIEKYPSGPVSRIFAPFLAECSFIGRQENLIEDFIAALTKAGETFDPAPIRALPEIGFPIDAVIREHAKAPLSLLRKVMEVERQFCEQWGYTDVPQAMIGASPPFAQAFYDLTPAYNRLQKKTPIEKLLRSAHADPVTPHMTADENGTDLSWDSILHFRRYMLFKREVLDTLDVAGKDVICISPRDWTIPLYLFGKGTKSVTVIDEPALSEWRRYSGLLSRHNFRIVSSISGARKIHPRGADIVLSLGDMAGHRHPFHYLGAMHRLVREDGILVVETDIVKVHEDLPLLFCPSLDKSPENSYKISYFNRKGLEDVLVNFGFSETEIPYEDRFGVLGHNSPYVEPIRKAADWQHVSDSGYARCAAITRKRKPDAEKPLADMLALWEKEIKDGMQTRWWQKTESPPPTFAHIMAQYEKIFRLEKYGKYWQSAFEDRNVDVQNLLEVNSTLGRDVQEQTKELEILRRDIQERTKELEILRRDVIDRTNELVETRALLVDRTARLEQALAGESENPGASKKRAGLAS